MNYKIQHLYLSKQQKFNYMSTVWFFSSDHWGAYYEKYGISVGDCVVQIG
jgi:hypothetical protein